MGMQMKILNKIYTYRKIEFLYFATKSSYHKENKFKLRIV